MREIVAFSTIYSAKKRCSECNFFCNQPSDTKNMLMKQVFFTLLFSLITHAGLAQTVSGSVSDARTREAIPYVNIGIVGRGIGTVSAMNGQFSLPLHDSLDDQTLKLSCIGYKSLIINVKDFKKTYSNKSADLYLDENVFTLGQVVVKPKAFKTKILGNTNHSRSVIAGFMSNDLGSELGTIMKIKRSPTFIEDVNFNIGRNLLDSVKFRVNIYSMKDGQPDSILLKEPIYITTKLAHGKLTVDMKKYNLWVSTDFFVSLEWIEDYGKNKLYFSAGLMDSNSMYRKTSQDRWHKASPVGIGFNSTVSYEK